MTQLDPKLDALGDRLERAAAADLAAGAQPADRPRGPAASRGAWP